MKLSLAINRSSAIALMVGFVFCSNQALAQTPQSDEITGLLACQSESDDAARLACFDAAVSNFAKAREDGDIITVSKEQIQNVERDSFGFSIPSIPVLSGLLGGNNTPKPKTNPLTDPVEKTAVERTKRDKRPNIPALGETESIKQVNLNIVKTQNFGYKKTRFFMDNGQVWEQTDTSRVRIPKITKDKKPVAEIRKGSLGSFLLQIDGKGRAVNVKRVR